MLRIDIKLENGADATVALAGKCNGTSLGDATKAIQLAEKDIQLPPSIHAAFQGTAAAFQNSLASERCWHCARREMN